MKKWLRCCVLITCTITLIACGHTTPQDGYTKDAPIDEQKSEPLPTPDSSDSAEVEQASGMDDQTMPQGAQAKTTPAPKQQDHTGKDQTTPPPASSEAIVENERIAKVTMSIDTKTLLQNIDKVAENKRAYVPSDGWILAPIDVEINDGESVFDVLSRVTRERRIHMEVQGASQSIYDSVYIQGIGQLYEFDCGELSGWMYTINGAYVAKGASSVPVEDGMTIAWRYTCDLGRDLGL